MKQDKNRGAELIVGIPSYREAKTIGFVTRQVDVGIQLYFPGLKACIINADNNSDDNTKGAFLSTDTATPKRYIATPAGVTGKGNNLRNLFKHCRREHPSLKAIVIVDADLKSITPEWIKYLAKPILQGYDYALPRYSRHQFDGTITNHICYPLLYGLLGINVRQPIGGDFAFSPRVMNDWLQRQWFPSTRFYGIDIFMTYNALMGKFKICEVGLGSKVHNASSPKLGAMFTQVVTTFFEMLLLNKRELINKPSEEPKTPPLFGLKTLADPQDLSVDVRDMKGRLHREFFPREQLLRKYLGQYLYNNFKRMIDQDHYTMSTLMWTQVVYQFLYTFHAGSQEVRKDIIEALKPLYFARSLSFDYETWRYRIDYAEELVLDQAMAFASQKPYFIGLFQERDRAAHKNKKRNPA